MLELDLEGRGPKPWKRTTLPDPEAEVTTVDLLARQFQPGKLGLNRCWAGDITYVRTWEGWLYRPT